MIITIGLVFLFSSIQALPAPEGTAKPVGDIPTTTGKPNGEESVPPLPATEEAAESNTENPTENSNPGEDVSILDAIKHAAENGFSQFINGGFDNFYNGPQPGFGFGGFGGFGNPEFPLPQGGFPLGGEFGGPFMSPVGRSLLGTDEQAPNSNEEEEQAALENDLNAARTYGKHSYNNNYGYN